MEAEWEPIDTIPKDATRVLVFAPGADEPLGIFAANEVPDIAPTHWMPLPPPPSDLKFGL